MKTDKKYIIGMLALVTASIILAGCMQQADGESDDKMDDGMEDDKMDDGMMEGDTEESPFPSHLVVGSLISLLALMRRSSG